MRSTPTGRPRAALALLALVATLGSARAACAHEYWLAASPARPAAGDTVEVRAKVGTGFRGDTRPWQRERAVRFERSDSPGTAIQVDAARAARDSVWARVVARPEGTLVWYESNFIGIELPADEFDAYLEEEGLGAVLAARKGRVKAGDAPAPGRERYRRAAKAWIAGRDTAQLAASCGLPLEIVALGDPASGRPLRLRVLAQGDPVAGALVRAWRQPVAADGAGARGAARRAEVRPSAEGRTDANGELTLALEGPGEWLVSTVRMVPSGSVNEADWESTWASLTFHRMP